MSLICGNIIMAVIVEGLCHVFIKKINFGGFHNMYDEGKRPVSLGRYKQ